MAEKTIELEKPLEEMNKAELFAVADELKIPGRYDMNKAQLLASLEEALTNPAPSSESEGEDAAADGQGESLEGTAEPDPVVDADGEQGDGEGPADADRPTNPSNPPPAEDAAELEARLLREAQERERQERETEERERELAAVRAREQTERTRAEREAERAKAHANGQLHEDDRLAIMRATTQELEAILTDPQLPIFIATAIRGELEARKQRAEAVERKRLQRSPMRQFKITTGPAGMRYVTKEAYVTTLPVGTIITPLAYDLTHVAEQGFTWEPIAGVELSEDQMGNPVSTAK